MLQQREGMEIITLLTYDNKRPEAEEIEKLILGKDYTYVVATKALERERKKSGLIPVHQEFKSPTGDPARIAVFNDLVRQWAKKYIPVASRGEEKTILMRAIRVVANSDPELQDVLKKDISAWVRALSELAAEGLDLSQGLNREKQEKLVNPLVGDLLEKLQQKYYEELANNKRELFERAARIFFERYYKPTPVIIMEGFTYLTELQKRFVEVCDQKGAHVIFIVPYRKGQEKGFEIIKRTYAPFKDLKEGRLKTAPLSQDPQLHFLHSNLFAAKVSGAAPSGNSVRLRRYPNRDGEIMACISQLQAWFDAGYKPKDVAVVMRRPADLLERFQDYLAMSPLTYTPAGAQGKKPVKVFTPPRLLLLTPVGRFVLTLYNIWEDGRLKLQADQLEAVLASGWLGAEIQDSANVFRAVKNQFFAHCESKESWEDALERLEELYRRGGQIPNRLPLHLVEREHIGYWNNVIKLLESVCQRLFGSNSGAIGDHIRNLQDELYRLVPEDIRRSEKEILEKIREVFNELASAYSIPMTTEEFGEALHALAQEWPDSEEIEDLGGQGEGRLWITTPEGIDGISRRCVIYIGADNQYVPDPAPQPWPFYEDNRDEHQERERYMFLAVIRSAKEQLVLSCAKKDGDRKLQPSMYFEEVARLLGRKVDNVTIRDSLDVSLAPGPAESVHCTPARNTRYRFNELAHYGLCPLRYRLKMLHPEAMKYRDVWQLPIAAQGVWLEGIYGLLKNYFTGRPSLYGGPERLRELFVKAMEHMEDRVKAIFPSFSDIDWHSIRQKVIRQLEYYVKRMGRFTPFSVIQGQTGTFSLLIPDPAGADDERSIRIVVEIPYLLRARNYDVPLLDGLLNTEWLLPSVRSEDEGIGEMLEIDNVKLFKNQYQAVQWWRKAIEGFHMDRGGAVFDTPRAREKLNHFREEVPVMLRHWVQSIEQNKFPQNPGTHCITCPVRPECLGIQAEEI